MDSSMRCKRRDMATSRLQDVSAADTEAEGQLIPRTARRQLNPAPREERYLLRAKWGSRTLARHVPIFSPPSSFLFSFQPFSFPSPFFSTKHNRVYNHSPSARMSFHCVTHVHATTSSSYVIGFLKRRGAGESIWRTLCGCERAWGGKGRGGCVQDGGGL